MKKFFTLIFSILFLSALIAQTVSENIHVDQFGYLPDGQKIAVLSDPQTGYNSAENYTPGGMIELVDNMNSSVVFSAAPTTWNNGNTHAQSGDKVWWFDFSAVTTTGEYYIYDPTNNLRSHIFEIENDVYDDVLKQTMRAFYFQRCGVAKTAAHGGDWNDIVCHNHSEQDLDCRLVTDPTNASLSKDLSGGWHDAGDYNKYVNFTHEPLHDLLFAYEENPAIWGDDFNLPESGNGTPDILDEIKVELDWLIKMQNTDGSVLMKVSVTGFEADSPPSADTAVRRYGPAQASSTRAVASIFAHAAIVYDMAGENNYAAILLSRAELAWDWVMANPATSNYDNTGFSSANPEVSASVQNDYLACAAVYLYAATSDTEYRDYFDANYSSINPYNWNYWYLFQTTVQDAMLYYSNLSNATPSISNTIQNNFVSSMHINNSDMVPAFLNNSDAYRAHIGDSDYVWGNNREKSHAGIMFRHLINFGLNNGGANDSLNYARAADGYLHYLHGVNPINKVMLSNMYDFGGENCANEIYHAWFDDGTIYDNALTSTIGPAPGIVPGGMNPNYAPDPAYSGPALEPPMNQPIQKSYKDWNATWPENSWEVTENSITYQAAYVNFVSKYANMNSLPLPVEMTSFNVQLIDDSHVQLKWVTASEKNNDYFIVEKSKDGLIWKELNKINGRGNSIGTYGYEFIDRKPFEGTNFYRIKQMDFDGSSEYSEVRSIFINNETNQIRIYPNPVKSQLNIFVENGNLDDFSFFNIVGQNVTDKIKFIEKGGKNKIVDISTFESGIYFFKMGDSKIKFIKE